MKIISLICFLICLIAAPAAEPAVKDFDAQGRESSSNQAVPFFNMQSHAGEIGKSFLVEVVGQTTGIIWGNEVYTLDSDLATAAVHAGYVKAGEKKAIKVTILPGRSGYTGVARNGVTSQQWTVFEGSYWIESAPLNAQGQPALVTPAEAAYTDDIPNTLMDRMDKVGQRFYIRTTGTTTAVIWGSDVYSADSDLSTAAVHAGILKEGEEGIVAVTMEPGRESYESTERNGVKSHPWGHFQGSYRLAKAPPEVLPETLPARTAATFTPSTNLYTYGKDKIGQSFEFDVKGAIQGSVWGTDIYTTDSSLEAAAVHAGVLKEGETARLRVTILEGKSEYSGTTRNGVTSYSWHEFPVSFSIERIKKPQP